jgi:hypothetical protein
LILKRWDQKGGQGRPVTANTDMSLGMAGGKHRRRASPTPSSVATVIWGEATRVHRQSTVSHPQDRRRVLTLSTARILAQMKTRSGRSSRAELWSSFST